LALGLAAAWPASIVAEAENPLKAAGEMQPRVARSLIRAGNPSDGDRRFSDSRKSLEANPGFLLVRPGTGVSSTVGSGAKPASSSTGARAAVRPAKAAKPVVSARLAKPAKAAKPAKPAKPARSLGGGKGSSSGTAGLSGPVGLSAGGL